MDNILKFFTSEDRVTCSGKGKIGDDDEGCEWRGTVFGMEL
jgi:hypothetical protein